MTNDPLIMGYFWHKGVNIFCDGDNMLQN